MILFEEEQLKKNLHPDLFNLIKTQLSPIELPSDEEIEKELLEHTKVSTIDPYKSFYFNAAMYGAKWMKQLILNQNK
jgi:hypothetical protein